MFKSTIGLFILILFLHTQPLMAGHIMAQDPWIREAPPSSMTLAGYLTLNNHGEKDRMLISAKSNDFAMVEMHLSKIHQGMMKMEKQERISLPQGKEISFKPGGYHLMLMNPKRELRSGDKVEIILVFEDGKELPVSFTVRKDTNNMKHGMDMKHDMKH